MKNTQLYILFIILIAFTFQGLAQRDCFPQKTSKLLYDGIGVLDPDDERRINNKLEKYAQSTSVKIAIVIVPGLCGYNKSDYILRLNQLWGNGWNNRNFGAIVLVKPTGGKGERFAFITIGNDLEGLMSEKAANKIVNQEMMPYLQHNDIAGGLFEATRTIIKLADGKISEQNYLAKSNNIMDDIRLTFILIVFLLTLLSLYLFRVRSYAQRNNIRFWTAFYIKNASLKSRKGSFKRFFFDRSTEANKNGGGSKGNW